MLLYIDNTKESFARELDGNIQKIEGDVVRIFQISDLHTSPPQPEPGYSEVEHENAFRENFREMHNAWNSQFAPDESAKDIHGLIVSGDLIEAREIRITERKEDSAKALDETMLSALNEKITKAHKFAYSCIGGIATDLRLDKKRACLVIPGNHDIQIRQVDHSNSGLMISSFHNNVHNHFCQTRTENHRFFVNAPRLCLFGNEKGLIALFGLDSNHAAYKNPRVCKHGLVSRSQLDQLKAAVNILRNQYSGRPVYVVVTLHHHLLPVESAKEAWLEDCTAAEKTVVSVTLDTPDVIKYLQELRVSLIVHGHMHDQIVQNVNYTWDEALHRLLVVGCPSFPRPKGEGQKPGDGRDGASVLSFDLGRGTAQVDILDMIDKKQSRSIVLPLTSITRVSAGEQRVHDRLNEWLSFQGASPYCADPHLAPKYKRAAGDFWGKTGYALLCDTEEARMPLSCDPSTLPTKRYRLLLAIDKKNDGTYNILLNNHIPLRDSPFGAWDAPLLPAFKSPADLMKQLRADLIRLRDDTLVQHVGNVRKRQKARVQLEAAIKNLSSRTPDELEEEVQEIAYSEFIKFSPTDGQPQRYVYSLCFLPSLSLSSSVTGSLASLLQDLPNAEEDAAFRYEPRHEGTQKPISGGFVWFPLDKWDQCPAILARNQDVMRWIRSLLDKIKAQNAGQRIPPYLLVGQADENTIHDYRLAQTNPRLLSDLEEKLRKVPLLYNAVLRPYKESKFIPVRLRKEGRFICIYDAADHKKLGHLRPSQRYVLTQGLARARQLREVLMKLDETFDPACLGTDQVGYLTTSRHSIQIDILPPLLEPVLPEERTREDVNEYLVCDGNHRIVEYCWNQELEVHALLMQPASAPYYVKQMPADQWDTFANKPLSTTPELAAKYTVRDPGEDIDKYLSEDILKSGKTLNAENRYRVYFRDFGKGGFNLGAQGGRGVE